MVFFQHAGTNNFYHGREKGVANVESVRNIHKRKLSNHDTLNSMRKILNLKERQESVKVAAKKRKKSSNNRKNKQRRANEN